MPAFSAAGAGDHLGNESAAAAVGAALQLHAEVAGSARLAVDAWARSRSHLRQQLGSRDGEPEAVRRRAEARSTTPRW